MAVETCIVKVGPLDAFNNVFFAEASDGSFQVAHSDITFSDAEIQGPDTQNDHQEMRAKVGAKLFYSRQQHWTTMDRFQ